MMKTSPDPLALEGFRTAVGSTFELRPAMQPARALALRLTRLDERSAPEGYEQFSAQFRGPVEPLLPQGTYAIHHVDLGEFPLFIVPVGRDGDGVHYEACVIRRCSA